MRRPVPPPLRSLAAGLSLCLSVAATAGEPTPADVAFFESRIRPLLVAHCGECHGGDELQGGLRLDGRAALLAGGDSGPAVVPGDAAGSLLIGAVRWESYEMPPDGKLPDTAVADLERWIDLGAPWPAGRESTGSHAPPSAFDLEARRAAHWAWRPVRDPAVPAVRDQAWPNSPVDRFVLARLEAGGLHPAPPADRRALIRRLSFDLTGLPPTPDAITRFLSDDRPEAEGRLVDRLLASPHFGERWGRHWLDLVRYAESRGHEFDHDAPGARHYRDYVIRAFNADVPHDRFVREQIAGDLLTEPRPHPTRGFDESILGTGFWHLGEWVHSPVDTREDEAERFEDMLDTASKTFLGLTVACARCHDHKFDAISTRDYYALAGYLRSSDYRDVRFETRDHNRRVARELDELDREANVDLRAMLGDAGASHMPEASGTPDESPGRVVVDYTGGDPREFLPEGFAFGPRPVRPGDLRASRGADGPVLTVATVGSARRDRAWDRLESIPEPATNRRGVLTAWDRAGKTLRTSEFELTSGRLSYQMRGGCLAVAVVDSHRLVVGPLHGETVEEVKPGAADQVRWVTHDLSRYAGRRMHVEFTVRGDDPLELLRIVDGDPPADARNGPVTSAVVPMTPAVRDRAARWLRDRERLAAGIRTRSRTAPAMRDGTGEDASVAIRGDPHRTGDPVPRRFLEALGGTPVSGDEPGSGRLDLADRIADPANPFTARVMANRVWHHLLGRGIVATVDDFGVLGERPTHPDLLDHLAVRFVERGWSVKALIREIVLSETYRMSGDADPVAVERDPANRLWHHRPPRRLGGEAVRDALLAVAGELRPALFGESIPVHLTPFLDGRGRPAASGPVDGDGRRSVYLAVRRNFPVPLLAAFDVPGPSETVGRRTVSNVPAQSLTLMNDPFVAGCARSWAARAAALSPDPTDRLRFLFETGFGRPPADAELADARAFLRGHPDPDAAWSDLAHALVLVKEFTFVP